MSVYAVILAGGGGTRLWPASRRQRPKQFLALAPGGVTLLEATVERVRPLVPPARLLVVTSAAQVSAVEATLPELPRENLLVEPAARSTAPAIALAARALERRGAGDAVMAVLPSDHVVTDAGAFLRTVEAACRVAADHLVTVGIPPTRPETGYGYLELAEPTRAGAEAGEGEGPAPRPVVRFVEKPDAARAREYVASGRHLWNSGMFFFRATRVLAETRRLLPEVLRAVDSRYEDAPSVSIDYGIMERASDIWAVRGEFGWSDVGSWADLADVHRPDRHGQVRLGGPLVAIDARDNVVIGDRLVALVGVEGLVVVVAGDAVLIVPKTRGQDVRRVVMELERRALDRYL